jgi:outer membrane protein
MMPRRLLVSGVVLAFALSLVAKEYKVGYIDSDAVISRYEAAKDAKQELDEATAEFKAEADSLRADWEQARSEYESQELTLSEEGKRAKLAEVEQRKRRYDGFLDQVYRTGGKIDQKNNELIAPIVEKISEAVSQLAEEEGFALVLDASKSEVVFAEQGLDITELVVEELNREFIPVGPTATGKLVYAIAPVFEETEEARQENIGDRIRQRLYDRFGAPTGAEMVANRQFNETAESRGYLDREFTIDEAVDVARVLEADYVIYGKCSYDGRRIGFTLTIADVGLNIEKKTQSGESNRIEELLDGIDGVYQALSSSVEQP